MTPAAAEAVAFLGDYFRSINSDDGLLLFVFDRFTQIHAHITNEEYVIMNHNSFRLFADS
jgi:hypothetical protein